MRQVMRCGRRFAGLALCAALPSWAGVFIQGTTVNPLSLPVSGAAVSFSDQIQTTTDSAGRFLLSDATIGVDKNVRLRSVPVIDYCGSDLVVRNVAGKKVDARLFTALGRTVPLAQSRDATGSSMRLSIDRRNAPGSGVYLLQLRIDGKIIRAKCVTSASRVSWQGGLQAAPAGGAAALAKSLAAGMLDVAKTGYQSRSLTVADDTVMGLVVVLYPTGLATPAAVAVIESTETRGFRTLVQVNGTARLAWANNSGLKSYLNYRNNVPLDSNTVQRSFKVVHLDNGLVRVTVAPDLGMRVTRVLDKTTSPARQMFDVLDDPANFTEFAQNIGGIKPNFQYYENSTGMINAAGNLNCKAGYFIENLGDGGARVVMNLGFDYQQAEEDCGFTGKYGDQTLTGVVTLLPGHADFTVRYAADNPNPTRRSDRLWTSACMPNVYANGVNGAWLFPVKYAIWHCCGAPGNGQPNPPWDVSVNGLAGIKNYGYGSYFALYPQYPFAGAYYGNANANHLRITDPTRYPGLKVYSYQIAPYELWGGTNVVFEAPGSLVNAFEPHDLVHRYYMARGIGKVTYANQHVAIATSGTSFSLVTAAPCRVTVYNYGQSTSPIFADTLVGPSAKVAGTFSGGLRVVAEGQELCNVQLPLTYVDNISTYNAVKASANQSGCSGLATFDTRYGDHYELEDLQTKDQLISGMASLVAVNNIRSSANADSLLSMAASAYRYGGFAVAQRYCDSVGTRRPEQTRYLRALMALEMGQTADFSGTVIEGNYFKALQFVKADQSSEAVAQLDALIAQRPDAVRPRLLRAYLTQSISDALRVYDLVPGSIELWTVLKELGYAGASARLDALVSPQHPMAAVRRDTFIAEIKQGTWRHARRYEYNSTWFEAVSMPVFPDTLKYKGVPAQ